MKADDVLAVIESPATPKRTIITGGTKKTATKTITKKSKAMVSKRTSMKKARGTAKKKR